MRTDSLSRRYDDDAWARRKQAILERIRIQDVVERVVKLKRVGSALQGCCPFHDETTPSFTLYPRGGDRVKVPFFVCYGCGAKGDVISFVMKRQRLDFREAVELLESENGLRNLQQIPAPKSVVAPQVGDREKAERARRIWRNAREIQEGDAVDLYLRGRCLLPPATYGVGDPALNAGWPVDLRYAPECWHDIERRPYAAMVAAIRAYDGTLLTVHRTYLAQRHGDAWSKAPVEKAKLVVGTFGLGFIRLGPDTDQMVGGEGIETSLSAMQLWRRSGICFVNSGRMKSVEPPFACLDFIYAADKGGKGRWGELLAHKGAQAFRTGRKVAVKIPRIPSAKGDFNDLLRLRSAGGRWEG